MSRARVLAAIRAARADAPRDPNREKALAVRLADPPLHVLETPAAPELKDRFSSLLTAQGADVIAVASPEKVPDAVAAYLRSHGLPLRVRSGTDPYLAMMPWDDELALMRGAAQPDDIAGLSVAIAGAAETGTLVLASGSDNPVTLAFLPETHVVIVREETLVAHYEDALARVTDNDQQLPRTLNLVSAPSRTGDIGGKLVMGAHGPRRLAVLLVASAAA